MNQCEVARLVVVHELLLAQPLQQFNAIGGVENFAQGVGLFQALDVLPGSQQMQVVVAQHAHQRLTNTVEKAQRLEGLRATVDQVAHQPQRVFLRIESNALQQALERIEAALQVADRIRGHQCRAPGTARRKGLMTASKRLPSSASIW